MKVIDIDPDFENFYTQGPYPTAGYPDHGPWSGIEYPVIAANMKMHGPCFSPLIGTWPLLEIDAVITFCCSAHLDSLGVITMSRVTVE